MINATCKLRMCFLDDCVFPKRTHYVFNTIMKNPMLNNSRLNEAGFNYRVIDLPPVNVERLKPNTYVGMIGIIFDDQDFWVERWGLKALSDKLTTWDMVNKLPENKDWYIGYQDFTYIMKCVLEIDAFNYDVLHKERTVIGVDGKRWLEEEDDITFGQDDVEIHSNEDYGKTDFIDLVANHYEECRMLLDLNPLEEFNRDIGL